MGGTSWDLQLGIEGFIFGYFCRGTRSSYIYAAVDEAGLPTLPGPV